MREVKTIPASGPRKNKMILGTILILIIAFLLLVAVFSAFASYVPEFTGKCVAIVEISAPLTTEGSPTTLMGTGYPSSEQIAHSIRSLNARPDVGAVLFVINSGGGSIVATHEIYDAIEEVDKPKVSYFREVAASGAYYIATGSDYIISEPSALTGSVGVIATTMSMEGLFDKLGIEAEAITSGENKDMGSMYENLSEEQRTILQGIVDEVFEDFKDVVIRNRGNKLNRDRIEEIFDGRVMTGKQALSYGLVDATGTKGDALLKAAELGNIEAESPEDVRVCYVTIMPSEGGLLSAELFANSIKENLNIPSLDYK